MSWKGFLKKNTSTKADSKESRTAESDSTASHKEIPEITFVRTTTNTLEVIEPPDFPDTDTDTDQSKPSKHKKSLSSHFHRPSTSSTKCPAASITEKKTRNGPRSPPGTPPRDSVRSERRLSERFKLGPRSRSSSATSVHVPDNLPEIPAEAAGSVGQEAEWEKRATLLAAGGSADTVHLKHEVEGLSTGDGFVGQEVPERKTLGENEADDTLQEAIRLHETGDLERSTALFGKLADPNGATNALSQVLYGLALRHGWGIAPSPELSLQYLRLAARSATSIESSTLSSASRSGGTAQGELVLAIFELANSFRHGWGVEKDPVAAYKYYEAAANLGDVDGMEWVAWCYLEGFGVAKDKFKAAQYLRLAESKGHKVLGNTWIWKEKYNPKS